MENIIAAQPKKQQLKRQRGYTLLEYCAGAAIIGGILVAALGTLGGSLSTAMSTIGAWAVSRAASMPSGNTGN